MLPAWPPLRASTPQGISEPPMLAPAWLLSTGLLLETHFTFHLLELQAPLPPWPQEEAPPRRRPHPRPSSQKGGLLLRSGLLPGEQGLLPGGDLLPGRDLRLVPPRRAPLPSRGPPSRKPPARRKPPSRRRPPLGRRPLAPMVAPLPPWSRWYPLRVPSWTVPSRGVTSRRVPRGVVPPRGVRSRVVPSRGVPSRGGGPGGGTPRG